MSEFMAFTAGIATGASALMIGIVLGACGLYGALLLNQRYENERRARRSAELQDALRACRKPSNEELAA